MFEATVRKKNGGKHIATTIFCLGHVGSSPGRVFIQQKHRSSCTTGDARQCQMQRKRVAKHNRQRLDLLTHAQRRRGL